MKHFMKAHLSLVLLAALVLLTGCDFVVAAVAFAADAVAAATPAPGLLDILLDNTAVLLAALLAVSEVLALIPGVKANSIFQLLVNGLKAMSGNQSTTGR
ncbi:MAG: hypothetical protein ACOY3Z_00965 [Thermodesulfobacteriota bacterium]